MVISGDPILCVLVLAHLNVTGFFLLPLLAHLPNNTLLDSELGRALADLRPKSAMENYESVANFQARQEPSWFGGTTL